MKKQLEKNQENLEKTNKKSIELDNKSKEVKDKQNKDLKEKNLFDNHYHFGKISS